MRTESRRQIEFRIGEGRGTLKAESVGPIARIRTLIRAGPADVNPAVKIAGASADAVSRRKG